MKNGTVRWLWDVSGRKKWYIAALSVLQMALGGSGVLYALLLRGIVDSAVAGDAPGFWRFVLYTVLLVAVQQSLRAVLRDLNERCKSALENAFKGRQMEELLRRDFASVNAVHTGEWLNRLTNDTAVVAGSLTDILPSLLGMAVKLVSAIAMILILERRFAFLILAGGAVMVVFTYFFRNRLKRLHKVVQEADGRLRVLMQERLGSMMVIRSFAAEKKTADEAEVKMAEHRRVRLIRNRFSNICNIGFGTAMSGMYLLGVCWCGYGILRHTTTFGTLTAVTQLIAQIQAPFANLTGVVPRYYAMIASAERLREVETLPESGGELLDREDIRRFYEERFAAVALEDVTFSYYPPSETVEKLDKSAMPAALSRTSLEIRRGEIVALTGQSGCGKSTALKLMMGVYAPDSGGVVLVDTNGNKEPVTGKWRRLFAYVPQGNALMSGTIREAVTFARPDLAGDGEAIREALTVGCAAEFVAELENGLDTPLGERGAGLSEGQLQRLAVARAIFSRCPVLLLDEATSALDAETEKRLLENLRGMTDRTVVIITHRPAALDICDRVLRFTEEGIEEA